MQGRESCVRLAFYSVKLAFREWGNGRMKV
jgi:hypothetical protein